MFNRTNADYHVKVKLSENSKDIEEYQTEIKKSFLTGVGPDLIINGVIDQNDMIQNGLITPVDDLIQDKSKYFEAVLQNGQYKGIQYGIPYEFYMETAAYPEKIIGNKTSITLENLLDISQKVGADAIALNISGQDIVFYYGLLDEINISFIDWNNRKSNLNSTEFIELITFASKYACPDNINERNYKEKIDTGAVISETLIIGNPDVMNYIDACFDGNVALAGYPKNEGIGVYAYCNMLYLNANATCPDGAKEFLNFIISHDVHMKNVEDKYSENTEQKHAGNFPIDKAAFYRELELAQAVISQDEVSNIMNGISYKGNGLSKENAEKLMLLAEEATPINYELFDIADIISEELKPFFLGEKTAEEAVNIMNSRVQIYLNE